MPRAPDVQDPSRSSRHRAEQLGLEDIFALLVLFRRFVSFVVLPAHRVVALPTLDVAYDMTAGCHVPLAGIALDDIDDGVEEVGLSMLASEVPTDDVVMVREMRLTVLATVDPL